MTSSPPDFIFLWKQHKAIVVSLALLVLLYILVRISNLTLLPIFADEAIYIRWAQVMRSEATLRFLPLSDGKQPLFMWSVIPFLKVFSDPLYAGRLVSVFTGLGSLLGIFFLTLQLIKAPRIALISAMLYILVPFSFFFDRMALADSMLTMWGIWSIYFAISLINRLDLVFALLMGHSLGFAWLTKSPAVFFLGMVPVSGLLIKKAKLYKKIRSKTWLTERNWFWVRLCCYWSISLLIAWFIYNLLRLGPEFHMIELRNRDYIYPWHEIISLGWKEILYKTRQVWSFYWLLLTPGVLVGSVWGVINWHKKHFRAVCFLLIWALLPIVIQVVIARSVTARYFLYTIPAWLILAGIGIQSWLTVSRMRWWKIVVSLLVFGWPLWTIWSLVIDPDSAPLPRIERHGYLEEWTSGHGLRNIAEYLKQESGVSTIVVGTEGFFGTTPDGLQIYFDKNPRVTVIGLNPIVDRISEHLLNSLNSNRVFLVVNDTRLKIADPETAGLHLIKAFPKAARPDGTRENLLFFELIPTSSMEIIAE